MGHPWSESAEAFFLFQLKQTVNFWRLGQSASYSLDVRTEGGADLVMKFHLPHPSDQLAEVFLKKVTKFLKSVKYNIYNEQSWIKSKLPP